MSPTSIGFLLMMVVLGGVIAYYADIWGRKIGKKRLHIGKLRPKHVAAITIILAGMLIPLITIGLVMAISSDVRVWILRGSQAIRDAQEAQNQLERIRKQVDDNEHQIEQLRTEQGNLVAQREKAQGQIQELTQSATKLRNDISSLERERSQLGQRLDEAQKNVAQARTSLDAVERDREATQADLALAKQNLSAALTDLEDIKKRSIEVEQEALQVERQLKSTLRDLEKRQEEITTLDARIGDLDANLSSARSELNAVQAELDRASRELESRKLQLDEAEARLLRVETLLQRTLIGLQGNLEVSRKLPLIIQSDEELTRIQLPAGQTRKDLEMALSALLRQSRIEAEQRGARPVREGQPAAFLSDHQLADGTIISVKQQEEAVIQAALQRPEPTVLIAHSFWNVFSGEPVPLSVVVKRNPLVYRQGAIVAEARVEGARSEEAVLRQIVDFLTITLKKKALEDEMIPAAGREQSLGQVSYEELFDLVRDVKETNRTVRVLAIATQDTRAADPLRLEFRIR